MKQARCTEFCSPEKYHTELSGDIEMIRNICRCKKGGNITSPILPYMSTRHPSSVLHGLYYNTMVILIHCCKRVVFYLFIIHSILKTNYIFKYLLLYTMCSSNTRITVLLRFCFSLQNFSQTPGQEACRTSIHVYHLSWSCSASPISIHLF